MVWYVPSTWFKNRNYWFCDTDSENQVIKAFECEGYMIEQFIAHVRSSLRDYRITKEGQYVGSLHTFPINEITRSLHNFPRSGIVFVKTHDNPSEEVERATEIAKQSGAYVG